MNTQKSAKTNTLDPDDARLLKYYTKSRAFVFLSKIIIPWLTSNRGLNIALCKKLRDRIAKLPATKHRQPEDVVLRRLLKTTSKLSVTGKYLRQLMGEDIAKWTL